MSLFKSRAAFTECTIFAVGAVLAVGTHGAAQLQITEVMYDSVEDSNWEWFEVHNSGTSSIDLDGFFFDDNGGAAYAIDAAPNISNAASGGNATNTVVPGGGTAVLYDGDGLDFDDSRFRSAWKLSTAVPLIGVASFPSLNNSGDTLGLWADRAAYGRDLGDADGDGVDEVVQFTNATLSLDYSVDFPDGKEASIAWNGTGDFHNGAEWVVSEEGIGGAVTSIQTFLPGMDPLNDAADIGNPGRPPSGTAPSGLHITEVMYNPASSDSNWEWVEIYNNTGAAIEFASSPGVLDDKGGAPLTEANIASGSVDDATVAILFNAANTTIDNMKAAWGSDNNYIPVTHWSALNNGGDLLGIWSELDAGYEGDKADDVFDSAIASLEYFDSDGWPADDGNGSIHLTDFSLSPANGDSWELSTEDDGVSFHAAQIFAEGAPEDHPGGDIGSPGRPPGETQPPTASVDFNGDSTVDCNDINMLYGQISSGDNNAIFDVNQDGTVDADDIPSFLAAAGTERGYEGPVAMGDADFNGIVDASDLNAVGLNWLQEGVSGWCQGDFTRDGTVDASDLNHVGLAWLSDVRGPAKGDIHHAVPEPSTILLAVVTLTGLGLRRKNIPF